MSFLWLKSLGNKILGCVTSLFGLSSAGGTKPADKQNKIPTNATLRQTQPTEEEIVLLQQISTTGNQLADTHHEKSEENADVIPACVSNELRTKLNGLKTVLGNKDYDNAQKLSEEMYNWADKQIKGKNSRTKSLLRNFQKLLFGMKNDITNKNCSTLISTLEMLLENDSLPIAQYLSKVLLELPQLANLEEAPKKNKIKAIAEGYSILTKLLKNLKPFQEKVAQHPEKWETIVQWLSGGEDIPDNEGLTLSLRHMNEVVVSLTEMNGKPSESMRKSFTLYLEKTLQESWPFLVPLRQFIGKCLYEEKISQFYELLEKKWIA